MSYIVFLMLFFMQFFGTIQYSEFSIQPKVQPDVQPKVLPKVLPDVQQKKLLMATRR